MSLDAVADGIQSNLPTHAEVWIGNVCRIELEDEDDTTKWTAIPVRIVVPGIKERVCLVNCE